MMKDQELRKLRDKAVYQVYLKGSEEGSLTSLRTAANYIRNHPAPRYYIDARTASLLIGRIEKHISLLNINSSSRRRIWQLYRRYCEYRKEHPESEMPREHVLEIIVEEPAPEAPAAEEVKGE